MWPFGHSRLVKFSAMSLSPEAHESEISQSDVEGPVLFVRTVLWLGVAAHIARKLAEGPATSLLGWAQTCKASTLNPKPNLETPILGAELSFAV